MKSATFYDLSPAKRKAIILKAAKEANEAQLALVKIWEKQYEKA